MPINSKTLLFSLSLVSLSTAARADFKTDIGYFELASQLGTAKPDGTGVKVAQVEASTGTDTGGNPIFAPDPTATLFSGKTFSYPGMTGTPSSYSDHAGGVGLTFYGNSVSTAPGITDIHSYNVNQWVSSLYNSSNFKATTTDRRLANHSWAGSGDAASNATILRFADRQVEQNEYIQVAAATNSPLLGNSFNAISVGLTSTTSSQSSVAVDSVYTAGRSKPDLVAPAAAVSHSTPIVSASAAMLIETGHTNTALSLGSSNIAGAGTIYNAERSETVKAILMAGANRSTTNTSGYGDITDFRTTSQQTANGLDDRYGAGQVNINNSYQIMTGGEQNSLQDVGSNSGQISQYGFDYDSNFGGAGGSNDSATYIFTAETGEILDASLVWNVDVSNDFAMDVTFYNMSLSLFDVTTNALVAVSESLLDNTQNIFWQSLIGGHEYHLVVDALGSPFNWDYALAWQRYTAVPVPAAFWLFGPALFSLIGFQRRKSGI